jgi:hypothetical protein
MTPKIIGIFEIDEQGYEADVVGPPSDPDDKLGSSMHSPA